MKFRDLTKDYTKNTVKLALKFKGYRILHKSIQHVPKVKSIMSCSQQPNVFWFFWGSSRSSSILQIIGHEQPSLIIAKDEHFQLVDLLPPCNCWTLNIECALVESSALWRVCLFFFCFFFLFVFFCLFVCVFVCIFCLFSCFCYIDVLYKMTPYKEHLWIVEETDVVQALFDTVCSQGEGARSHFS